MAEGIKPHPVEDRRIQDTGRAPVLSENFTDLAHHLRVNNGLEPGQGGRIGKDKPAEHSPVNPAPDSGRLEDSVPESRPQGGFQPGKGTMPKPVEIDDRPPPLAPEDFGRQIFAAGHHSSQTENRPAAG